MQISLHWLREWVQPSASPQALAHALTMAGIEAAATPISQDPLQGVVIGKIVEAVRHPQADRLQVCQVDVGDGNLRQIVCGAANARIDLRVPCALPGAELPGGLKIGAAKLRGVDSAGMLCSAKELALTDKSEGLLELDATAPVGQPIAQYLQLDDHLIALDLTPNRGDVLSARGLARELAAIYGLSLNTPSLAAPAVTGTQTLSVSVSNADDCPAYTGCVITGINPLAQSPDWLRERLRRSGIRSIHPIVDITNYVMLEWGNPLHAFDLAKLSGGITVRRAAAGEQLTLLNGEQASLKAQELVIADARGPIALAGVMGGADSGVTDGTTEIFLEAAAFAPAAVMGTARRHKLSSEAAYRFERGVDPTIHAIALQRAVQLTLAICGGTAHPVVQANTPAIGAAKAITLDLARCWQLLGFTLPADVAIAHLERLGVIVVTGDAGLLHCTPPAWRFDLAIPQDLAEELARLSGYQHIPAAPYAAHLVPQRPQEGLRPLAALKASLVARGWQEAITYSFVDAKLLQKLQPDTPFAVLDNPIAETMNAMRTTLWAGLIEASRYNLQRQAPRVRLFESGVRFYVDGHSVREVQALAGLAVGSALPEQWGSAARAIDFYDVKADVEALLRAFGGGNSAAAVQWQRATHPALHPGRSASLWRDGQCLGVVGELHPALCAELDFAQPPQLFELDAEALAQACLPTVPAISEFPASRRDLAVLVDEAVPVGALIDTARLAAGEAVVNLTVFDVYRGKGLPDGQKSVGLGLIFQHPSRTLTVEEVDAAIASVCSALSAQHQAALR